MDQYQSTRANYIHAQQQSQRAKQQELNLFLQHLNKDLIIKNEQLQTAEQKLSFNRTEAQKKQIIALETDITTLNKRIQSAQVGFTQEMRRWSEQIENQLRNMYELFKERSNELQKQQLLLPPHLRHTPPQYTPRGGHVQQPAGHTTGTKRPAGGMDGGGKKSKVSIIVEGVTGVALPALPPSSNNLCFTSTSTSISTSTSTFTSTFTFPPRPRPNTSSPKHNSRPTSRMRRETHTRRAST
jgi:hypothetical protein